MAPDDRVQRHAGGERALADLADDLAHHALLVDPALAGDDARAAAQALVEADRVEDVRGTRLERRVEARPQTARQATGRAGHGDAARVARKLRRVGVEAL